MPTFIAKLMEIRWILVLWRTSEIDAEDPNRDFTACFLSTQ